MVVPPALLREARAEVGVEPVDVADLVVGVQSGLPPAAVPEVLALANTLSNVQVCGLMTMPPLSADPEKARPFFRQLRGLRDQWAAELKFDLPELSMGMTHDLEIAVEEGATWVRVGTAIFGPRPCALRPLEET